VPIILPNLGHLPSFILRRLIIFIPSLCMIISFYLVQYFTMPHHGRPKADRRIVSQIIYCQSTLNCLLLHCKQTKLLWKWIKLMGSDYSQCKVKGNTVNDNFQKTFVLMNKNVFLKIADRLIQTIFLITCFLIVLLTFSVLPYISLFFITLRCAAPFIC